MKNMNQISKVAALSILTALMANCTNSGSQSADSSSTAAGIVNGQDISKDLIAPGQIGNSVVALMFMEPNSDSGALCSGTLIAPDMILTAGHCVVGQTAANGTVFFQALALGPDAVKGTVKNMQAHAGFVADSSDSKDDIAIIQLASAAPAEVLPAQLAPATEDLVTATKVTLGYGQSDERFNTPGERNGSGVLRGTMVMDGSEVVTAQEGGTSKEGMLAANSSLTGTCHGDSGGPLFAVEQGHPLLAAITESGIPRFVGQQGTDWQALIKAEGAEKGSADFYKKYPDAHVCSGVTLFVNVTSHLDWIQQTMTALRAQK